MFPRNKTSTWIMVPSQVTWHAAPHEGIVDLPAVADRV